MEMAIARTAQSLMQTARLLLLGSLLLGRSVAAQTRALCDHTGLLISSMNKVTKGGLLGEPLEEIGRALPPAAADFVASCVQLKEQESIQFPGYQPKLDVKEKWFGFTPEEFRTLPVPKERIRKLYDDCRKSTCGHDDGILSFLLSVCKEQLGGTAEGCDDELKVKPTVIVFKPPRAKWRTAVGSTLIGLGGVAIVLGSVHLGVPFFHTTGGCIQYGLDHPCVADRFGVGGALLGVGLAAVGGGILTLTLP